MVSMKLVTPGKGTITLSKEENAELFNLAKVGLGALGVVSEVTLQLGKAHTLLEHTYVMSGKVGCRSCSSFISFVRQAGYYLMMRPACPPAPWCCWQIKLRKHVLLLKSEMREICETFPVAQW